MTATSLNDGPFQTISHMGLLDKLFKTVVTLRNFTEKELDFEIPGLSKEARNQFFDILDRNPQLADRKELNLPNASSCRYTLTDEGVAAIQGAFRNLSAPKKAPKMKWDRPKHNTLQTPLHA